MPITKQAIKRMKQNSVSQARNRHYTSRMKSMMKLILTYLHEGEVEKAQKIHSDVVKSIDTAAKKNLIHKNNAARKKSRLQLAMNHPAKMAKPSKALTSDKKTEKPKKAAKKSTEAEVEAGE